MAVQDQIEAVVREVWRINQLLGWSQRIGMDNWDDAGGRMGRIAKAAGATPEQVEAWMRGDSVPATGQALAVLSALPFPALPAAALNGSHARD